MSVITDIFLEYFKQNKLFVTINLLFAILIPLQNVYLPNVYGKLIDSVKNNKLNTHIFIYIIILLTLLQIGHALSSIHDIKFYPDFQSFIRMNMVKTIFNRLNTDFNELETGKIIAKFVKIPSYISKWYDKFKGYILPYILSYIISIIIFFMYDKILGVSLFLLLFTFILIIILSVRYSYKLSVERDNVQNEIYEEIEDVFKNLIYVYSYNQEENEIKNISLKEVKYKESYTKMMEKETLIRIYITPMIILFLIVFLLRFKSLSRTNHFIFVPIFMILIYILNSMIILTDQTKELLFDIGIIFNFDKIIEKKLSIEIKKISSNIYSHTKKHDCELCSHKSEYTNGILFENIKFGYNNKNILNNFNLYIPRGTKIAIIGDVGSGKSTITKLLLKLKVPQSGNIYLNGINYNNLSTYEIRNKINYLQQNSILFNRSIIDNIKYGNNVDDHIIINLFNKYNLYHYIPDIYESSGKNGSFLSGGQKQIILSLRLILSNSEIIILDEHTSALDNNLKYIITKMIFNNSINKTIIIISHDKDIIKYASKILNINR